MYIKCLDNYGFEDLLSIGKTYHIVNRSGNSVQITDDSGNLRWYGQLKFRDIYCPECEEVRAA